MEGVGDDGEGGGGGFPSCGLGLSLLAFIVAKMVSVPIKGDRCLTGKTRVENASRLLNKIVVIVRCSHRVVVCGGWQRRW